MATVKPASQGSACASSAEVRMSQPRDSGALNPSAKLSAAFVYPRPDDEGPQRVPMNTLTRGVVRVSAL